MENLRLRLPEVARNLFRWWVASRKRRPRPSRDCGNERQIERVCLGRTSVCACRWSGCVHDDGTAENGRDEFGRQGGLVGWADRDSQMLSDSGECWFGVGGLWLEDESQRDGAGLALARNSERRGTSCARALPAGLFYHAFGSLGPLFKETKLGLAAACAAKTQVSPPLPTCGTARA